MPEENEVPDEEQAPQEPEEGNEEQPTEPEDDGFDPEKAREKIRKINSENRTLRERAKKAETKAQEAEGKGEQLTKLEAENMRLRIAVKHGLPESLVKRLSGTTEEEILQDAEELMELVGGRKPPTQQSKEKLRTPGSQTSSAGEIDYDKLAERALRN
jgi:hypothetical protein